MSVAIEFEHFIGTNTIPNGVHFHPNGVNYVIAAGNSVVIGDLTNSQYQDFFRKHDDQITCIALSSTGHYLASGQKGDNSNIYVWNFSTSKLIYSFEEHDHYIQCLAFSHDEKLLVSVGGSDDRKIVAWDLSNGCIIAVSVKIPAGTSCLCHGGFVRETNGRNSDHYQLATGGEEGIEIWDLDPYIGEIKHFPIVIDTRANISRCVTSVIFSNDKEHLFAGTTSGDYVVVSMTNLRTIKLIQSAKMGLLSMLVDNVGVIIGCGDNTIRFYDDSGRCSRDIKLDGAILGMSYSPDRREVLALTGNGTVSRLNVSSGKSIVISESHTQGVVAVAYAIGSSDRFATASSDGSIRLWDATEYTMLLTGRARKDQEREVVPQCIALQDMIYSGWSDGKVLAHCAESGAPLWVIDNVHSGGVTSLILSNNKRFLLTGGFQGDVRLWELRSRELVCHLKEHTQKVTALALFQNDTMAISASRDRCLLRWDLKSEKRVHCHMQRMGGINSVAIGRSEEEILSVGQEKKLTYWDIKQNEPTRQFSLDAENDEGRAVAMYVHALLQYLHY
jgi:cilia- and flagella-associated protein 52